MKRILSALAGTLFLLVTGVTLDAHAQGLSNSPGEVSARVQAQLDARYTLTRTTDDHANIITPGAVLVLQKDNFVMAKVYMNATQRGPAIQNTYTNGEITQIGFTGALSKVNSFLTAIGGLEPQSQSFLSGSRLWVTNIAVQQDGIVFTLLSDPINGMRYHGTLQFPYASVLEADQAVATAAEVLNTDPPFDVAEGASQAAQSATPISASAAPALDGEDVRRAADAGDTNAMYQLGNIVAQKGNDVEAARWFRSASERGHVKATNALGFMYEEGRGVPQNFEQAARLYLQAMKKGDADAMVNRGLLFEKGRGVTADRVQAYMHFLLSVAYAPDKDTREAAVKLRDEAAAKLTNSQVARGQSMADKFAKEQIK